MKRLFLLPLLFLTLPGLTQNFDVSPQEAVMIAERVMAQNPEGTIRPDMAAHKTVIISSEFNIVDFGPGQGFVIVAGDKRVHPVLAYSYESDMRGRVANNSLNWLLDGYASDIDDIRESKRNADPAISSEWASWLGGQGQPKLISVSPLLTSQWGQGCFYNADCPLDSAASAYYCYHVPTGCVATAMAQIMKYHEYPLHGTGSHSYMHFQYGTLSANYAGSTYQWNQMPQSATSPAPEIAELMFHCGVGVNMTYGPVSSGSYASDARNTFVNYFNYAGTCVYRQKVSYTDPVWHGMLQNELDNGRPVFYGGLDPNGYGGHAWVVDGYQGSYYHVNWGWDGAHNGYFLLTALSPQGNANFTNFHEAIMGIEPASPALTARFSLDSDTLEVGDTAYYTDLSLGNPSSWEWTFYGLYGNIITTDTKQVPDPVLYIEGGFYDVRLVVSDGLNSDTLLREEIAMVLPIVRFRASTRRLVAGTNAYVDFFDETITRDPIVNWNWAFDLMGYSSLQNPVNIQYWDAGSHAVFLSVITQGGKTGFLEILHYIDAYPWCDTMFAATVPDYEVATVDQANFSIGNYDLDGLTPYYAGIGHTSDWNVFNDVISPGDTNFFYGATSWFQSPGQADNWLVFGPLTIPGEGAYFEWEHLYWLNTKRDGYEVLLSETGGQPLNFQGVPLKSFIDNDPHTDNHTDWTPQNIDLDSLQYGGKQIWIAFHHYGNNMSYVFLDDFHLTYCVPWTGLTEKPDRRQSLELFPNPTSDMVLLRIPEDMSGGSVRLTDMQGRIIRVIDMGSAQKELSISLEGLSSGTYMVSLLSGHSIRHGILIKE